jgi:hypothetical protein
MEKLTRNIIARAEARCACARLHKPSFRPDRRIVQNLQVSHKKIDLENPGFIPRESYERKWGQMAIYGYARVSTGSQSLAAQDAMLRQAGCIKIFAEKASGAKTDRKALAKAIAALGKE